MKLSLVVPVFNEEDVLPATIAQLRSAVKAIGCEYEMIFVNDGSRDGSFRILSAEAALDPRIKVLSFSRNFGHQVAVTAGLDFASGDAVVVMDSDLQDPPELLPRIVALHREHGYDIVSPQRVARQSDSWFKRKTAQGFYAVMGYLADVKIPAEVGDFRLFSRRAVVAMQQLREQHRFMRGMVAWLGLRETLVPFERRPRAAGSTKYPLWKMMGLAWTGITSFSAMPLRLTMGMGLTAVFLAFVYLIYAGVEALVLKHTVRGWASLVFLQCLLSGMTLISVGLIGDYVARIYQEAKGRPLYVVNHALNLRYPRDVSRMVVLDEESPNVAAATDADDDSETRLTGT